ncbi:unnamed protein product [Fraxinus pennsylvanica]|uniref:Uncharacterized protein n=1 Tax=Fraxinus pennsylvanica TaxID=56036 RepID=A0AAD1YYQ3_9LAMI|nr:unnamed protein product [Fraxinus pennsylvanica]
MDHDFSQWQTSPDQMGSGSQVFAHRICTLILPGRRQRRAWSKDGEMEPAGAQNSDREYGGDKLPINAEATDSSGSPVEGRTNSSMNISAHHSGDKRKTKHRKGKAKKKMFGAREVSTSLEQMEGDRLHLFALWFLRDKDNRNSYCAAKTPHLRFKFIEYCFERDNMSINHVYASSETDCDVQSMSDSDSGSDEDVMEQLEDDINTWLQFCRIAHRIVRDYLAPNRAQCIENGSVQDHTHFPLQILILRTIGILLPIYIMVKALTCVLNRRNHQDSHVLPIPTSDEENEIPRQLPESLYIHIPNI